MDGSGKGFLNGTHLYNTKFNVNYNHYLLDTCLDFWWFQHTFHWAVAFGYGIDLDSDQVFGLGYTNGMRGYDYYAFTGNKLLRFNVEDRIFIKKQPFGKILALGLLLFWDAGYVWQDGKAMDLSELRYDVGLGLRLAFPFATAGNIVKFNLGFPIGHGAKFFSDVVFTFEVGSTFG